MMKKFTHKLSLLTVFSLLLVGCGDKPTGDLLARIQKKGEIVVSTDATFPPQSSMTATGEFVGFDIDVAKEIAKRLGVKVKFVTPGWDIITAGNWVGRWDMSVGSMMITTKRRKILDFAMPPYYYTLAQLTAIDGSGIDSLKDVDGQKVCVGAATTYESWLKGDLKKLLSDESDQWVAPPIGVTPHPLPTDNDCLVQIKAGKKEFLGFLASNTLIDAAIKKGIPIHKVGSPVFVEKLAVAFDKNNTSLVEHVSEIIAEMHGDGTLKALSMKWFDGMDYSQKPAK